MYSGVDFLANLVPAEEVEDYRKVNWYLGSDVIIMYNTKEHYEANNILARDVRGQRKSGKFVFGNEIVIMYNIAPGANGEANTILAKDAYDHWSSGNMLFAGEKITMYNFASGAHGDANEILAEDIFAQRKSGTMLFGYEEVTMYNSAGHYEANQILAKDAFGQWQNNNMVFKDTVVNMINPKTGKQGIQILAQDVYDWWHRGALVLPKDKVQFRSKVDGEVYTVWAPQLEGCLKRDEEIAKKIKEAAEKKKIEENAANVSGKFYDGKQDNSDADTGVNFTKNLPVKLIDFDIYGLRVELTYTLTLNTDLSASVEISEDEVKAKIYQIIAGIGEDGLKIGDKLEIGGVEIEKTITLNNKSTTVTKAYEIPVPGDKYVSISVIYEVEVDHENTILLAAAALAYYTSPTVYEYVQNQLASLATGH